MRKKNYFAILPLCILGLVIASCNNQEVSFTKTKIKQTYSDYTANNVFAIDSTPTKGNPRLLVLPIWFSDSDEFITTNEYKNNVLEDIKATYTGTKEEIGWHSVKSFYEEESHYSFTLDATISGWYNAGKSYQYYAKGEGDLPSKATSWYFNTHKGDNRKNYDSDSDGYLDGIVLIYAAPDNSHIGEEYSGLWAYTSWLRTSPNKVKPEPNALFWASYDFMYGSNLALQRTGKDYATGDTRFSKVDAHCFIHEMGHMFGLPDYYDYGGSYSPAAGFTMQDYNVGGHDSVSVMSFGWANPYIPKKSMDITINDFQSSHDLIVLSNKWNKYNSPFDEYIAIDLYAPTGLNEFDTLHRYKTNYPQGVDAVGIRIWHVDMRTIRWGASGFDVDKDGNLIFYTDVSSGENHLGFSNTYIFDRSDARADMAYLYSTNDTYAYHNNLHLIRKDHSQGTSPTGNFISSHLFYEGDTFSLEDYQEQFIYEGTMNNGLPLGWSVEVNSITNNDDGTYSCSLSLAKN